MLTLSAADRAQLATDADASVIKALDGSLAGWKGHAPANEPDAVAAVVSAGLPDAAAAWAAVLQAYRINVQITGVFCHATPYVYHQLATPKCELADILLVVDEGAATPPRDRRALLVQAKLSSHLRLSGPELVQLDLYQHHPDFWFANSPYPGNHRNVRGAPGHPAEGFEYGLICLTAGRERWDQTPPANPLVVGAGTSLGETLANMATGRAGRETIPGGRDPWSDTIEELMTTTFNVAASSSYGGNSRGVTTLAYMAQGIGGNGLGLAWTPPDGPDDEEGPQPLSLVHVRLSRWEG